MNFVISELSWYLPVPAIRALLRKTPRPTIKKIIGISDTMARRSREIVAEKKALLQQGDEALAHEVGEGKDIMSILRTYHYHLTCDATTQDVRWR